MRALLPAIVLVLAVALLAVSPVGSFAEVCFFAKIDGNQAGTGSSATGTAWLTLNDAQTELTYNIEFSGLSAAETNAHIHSDAEGGGIVHPLAAGSPKIGTWDTAGGLTGARGIDLLAGSLYINIHSSNFPGGEIRGQILPGPCLETCFDATIDGAQAGTGSPATGTGLFSLNHNRTELTYVIEFSGLLGTETNAHIHSDAEGGGIVHPLAPGTPKVGVWNTAGGLTAVRVADLLAGSHYVNIHSTTNPGGEIRGQIIPGSCSVQCFEAAIDGSLTSTPGTGIGLFSLNHTKTKLAYNIQFSGLTTAETGAHIHSDTEGGGVVHPLVAGSPKIGSWDTAGGLTPARAADLEAGDHYVNIHSINFPTGELRGQILPTTCDPTCFYGTLDGAQAGTGSPGLGTAAFTLNFIETELTGHVTFSGLSTAETGAHIHSDAEGGGVVHPLPAGNPKFSTWRYNDAFPLTPARVADLKADLMYVNIHSINFPPGEIKGQLLLIPCNATGVPPVVPEHAGGKLEQNHPNPFNPTTTITYVLAEKGPMTLTIYDVKGRLVRTLFNGIADAGEDHAVWNGKDNAGETVATGVYFYRLASKNFTATRKMVFLK